MPSRAPQLEGAIFFAMAAAAGVAVRPKTGSRPGFDRIPRRDDTSLRILIVTDAWAPQVNGVVRTFEALARELNSRGHEVRFATPDGHMTMPLPTYPEIRLALFPRARLEAQIEAFQPNAIHIATEATLGFAARAISIERGLKFTTSFHTRFPQYVHARFPFISEASVMGALRTFHAPTAAVMAATDSFKRELEAAGFDNVRLWSRGVDVDLFKPRSQDAFAELGLSPPRPIFVTVGRLAVEKNIDAFLALDLPGTKVVIGDGPAREELQLRYPETLFLGRKSGAELAGLYASSDVFVFPSRTDTFGLVLLEALASGTPVAAFPVQAPLEVIGEAPVAALDEDLRSAALAALNIPRDRVRRFALERTWRRSADQFLANLAVLGDAGYDAGSRGAFDFSKEKEGETET